MSATPAGASAIYSRQRLGQVSGIGARCGLVLVDFINGFVDEALLGPLTPGRAPTRTITPAVAKNE